MSGRHLVIGASGLVGGHLLAAADAAGHDVVGTHLSHPGPGTVRLDVRDGPAVRRLLEAFRPDVVHLPACMPNVDAVEDDPLAARPVNVDAVATVARECERIGARLVYVSTDYVFDGVAGPYAEDAEVAPVQEYGRQKAEAEAIVRDVADAVVARTTVVYGIEAAGKNFLARLARTLRAGRELRVPADQVGTPTSARALAAALVDLGALPDPPRIVHVAGPDLLDRHAFAILAARALGLDASLVVPVDTPSLGQRAARPLRAGLRTDLLAAILPARVVGVEAGLAPLVPQLTS